MRGDDCENEYNAWLKCKATVANQAEVIEVLTRALRMIHLEEVTRIKMQLKSLASVDIEHEPETFAGQALRQAQFLMGETK